MKRFLAMILALLMVASLTACGGEAEPTKAPATQPPASEPAGGEETDPPAPVDAEPISYTPLIHLDFETADGLTAVVQAENDGSLGDATYAIVPSNHPILLAEGQGAVGNALYLDGKYGVDFDMVAIPNDTYTISFWYNADRVATYGPVVTMGRNMGLKDPNGAVSWINVTKTTWGAADADIFPVVWNRNSEYDVWPWTYAMDDLEHGKREWCLLTIVVTGERYVADDGLDRTRCKVYLDGELKWDANGENMFYQGISPDIFAKAENLEAHIGINYWDTTYKGFIDELYVYGEALTDGQVKTLFEQGNPPASPVAPETPAYEEEGGAGGGTEPIDPDSLAAAPVDSNAIDTLGTPDRVLGFWSDTTAGYELADGKTLTMKLNNYSNASANWCNFVLALTNTAVTTDKLAGGDNYDGYAEYAVLRADAFGWGPEGQPYDAKFEMSWTDWVAWLNLMTDAEVEVVLTRAGGEVTVNYTFTGADGTVMTEKAVVNSALTAADPCYVHVTGEGAYIELLSVN